MNYMKLLKQREHPHVQAQLQAHKYHEWRGLVFYAHDAPADSALLESRLEVMRNLKTTLPKSYVLEHCYSIEFSLMFPQRSSLSCALQALFWHGRFDEFCCEGCVD
jgi:hypothetical protein